MPSRAFCQVAPTPARHRDTPRTPNFALRGRWAVGMGHQAFGHWDTDLAALVPWRRSGPTRPAPARSLSPGPANSLSILNYSDSGGSSATARWIVRTVPATSNT